MKPNRLKQSILQGLLFGSLMSLSSISLATTITEVIEKTLKTNPELQEVVSLKTATQYRIDQAKAGYYPKADVSLGIGRERTHSSSTNFQSRSLERTEAGFTASQMLFDGFHTKHSVDAAESQTEAATYRILDSSENTAFNAARVYLNVLLNNELVTLTEDNLAAHERVSEQVTLRSNSGVGKRSNVDQSEARLALSNANMASAKGNLIDASTNYNRVVGEEPLELENQEECCSQVPATLKQALDTAMKEHPSLKRAVADYEASMAQVGMAKAAMYPKLNLELEGNANGDVDGVRGHDKDLRAMFRLRQNVYNGGADSAKITQNKHLVEQQKQIVLQTQRQVESEVRLAWNELQRVHARLPYLETHAKSSQKSLEAAQQQFNLGQRTLLDLLDIENEKFSAQSAYLNTFYAAKISCYRVLASMGVLVKTLGIEQLPEATLMADNNAQQATPQTEVEQPTESVSNTTAAEVVNEAPAATEVEWKQAETNEQPVAMAEPLETEADEVIVAADIQGASEPVQ